MTPTDFKWVDDMIKLHAVKRLFVFDKDGKKYYLFDAPAVTDQDRAPEGPEEDQRARVPQVILKLGARIEELLLTKWLLL